MPEVAAAVPTPASPVTDGAAALANDLAGKAPEGNAPEATPAEKSKLDKANEVAERARKAAEFRRTRENELAAERAARAKAEERAARAEQEAKRQGEAAQRATRLEADIRQNPFGVLEKYGVTAEQLAATLQNFGTPQAEIQRMMKTLEEGMSAKDKRIEQLEERIKQREMETEKAVIEERIEENKKYISDVTDDAAKYPHLSTQPKRALIELVNVTAQQAYDRTRRMDAEQRGIPLAEATGKWYDLDEVLDYLESEYATAPRKTRAADPKDPPSPPAGTAPVDPKAASTRSSEEETPYELPENISDLPDDEQREHFAKFMKSRRKPKAPSSDTDE